MENKIFVLTGPSGGGKSTIGSALMRFLKLAFCVSCTTRAPRKGEIHGQHYFFVTDEEFDQKNSNGEFAESNPHHGARYGTLKSEIISKLSHGSILLDVDVNGAEAIKKSFPDAVVIYIDAPSAAELKRRLLSRGTESLTKINKRIERYRTHEKAFRNSFDYRIVNKDKGTAIADALAIVYQEMGGLILAVDGPSACGKGSLCKKLAEKYEAIHLDSGRLYRHVTYMLAELQMDKLENWTGSQSSWENALQNCLKQISEEYSPVDDHLLRTKEIDADVKYWASLGIVRDTVFYLQLAATYGSGAHAFVAEGRDMTTNVFRFAKLKFFVYRALKLRAASRAKQNGLPVSENYELLKARDHADRTRKLHPLRHKRSAGVIGIDNNSHIQITIKQFSSHITQMAA